jgi:uncharacterized protein (TIGR03435 family)
MGEVYFKGNRGHNRRSGSRVSKKIADAPNVLLTSGVLVSSQLSEVTMARFPRGASLLPLAAGILLAQSTAKPPAFEVASIKAVSQEHRVHRGRDFRVFPGGRLLITNLEVRTILREAYGIKNYQLSGGPGWMDTDSFDIEAKAEGDPTRAEMMVMLQTLLADRFALKIRRESKEANVYALTVAKGGPKLQEPAGTRSIIHAYRNTPVELPGVSYTLGGEKASMALFANQLEGHMMRPVSDRTGLTGEYNFKVTYATDDNPETGAPLIVAIQEQLGLKLETIKGSIETFVIERLERPTEN